MGKYLVSYRVNPVAPWPSDPEKLLQMYEQAWAAVDALIEKGLIEDMGAFLDANSGFAVANADSEVVFQNLNTLWPFWLAEVKEAVSWDKAKEIWRATVQAQIEAAKK